MRACAELLELFEQQDRNPHKKFWKIIVGDKKNPENIFLRAKIWIISLILIQL
jgi:hypothetical protein